MVLAVFLLSMFDLRTMVDRAKILTKPILEYQIPFKIEKRNMLF